jgi:hydrogenase expression/formation protein HypC
MCIGIPMQVGSIEPGHALCSGRGETRRVRTALVGDVARGDWLLVFIDSAQERLAPQRVAEINATLDLLQAAMNGDAQDLASAAFDLPSRWTTAQLRVLSGALSTPTPESIP